MTTQLEYEIERMRDFARHNRDSEMGYAKIEAIEQRDAEITKRMKSAGISPDLIDIIFKGNL